MQRLLALASVIAILVTGNTGAWAIGPSFDCAGAQAPDAHIVCSSPELSQAELALMQAYYALRWQVGSAGWAPLRQEDEAFESQTLQQCAVPKNGPLPPDTAAMAACMQRAHEHQRDTWMARLRGPAAEEAARPLQLHITLQRQLQQSGFLPATETVGGVYGTTTRTAISAWQRANKRPETGFLSDADAATLRSGQPASTAPGPAAAAAVPPPMVPPAARPVHANLPDFATEDHGGGWPSDWPGLKALVMRVWDRGGPGGIVMVLGVVVLLVGLGRMIRPPSKVGGGAGSSVRPGPGGAYAMRGSGLQVRRAPKLMVWGVVIALSWACVAYGPSTVYQAVEQAFTNVFA